jgi:hypothetical protein
MAHSSFLSRIGAAIKGLKPGKAQTQTVIVPKSEKTQVKKRSGVDSKMLNVALRNFPGSKTVSRDPRIEEPAPRSPDFRQVVNKEGIAKGHRQSDRAQRHLNKLNKAFERHVQTAKPSPQASKRLRKLLSLQNIAKSRKEIGKLQSSPSVDPEISNIQSMAIERHGHAVGMNRERLKSLRKGSNHWSKVLGKSARSASKHGKALSDLVHYKKWSDIT